MPNKVIVTTNDYNDVTDSNGLPVKVAESLPAGTNLLGKVGIDQTTPGTTNKVVAELTGSNTRQQASDTILIGTGAAHAAGDVVSTDVGEILQFDTGLPAGQSGMILDSLVTLDNNAVFSGGAGYELYLYDESPTAQATNAAFNLTTADAEKCIGKIIISTLVDKGDSCIAVDTGHNLSFNLASGDTKLYGKLVCLGGETTVTAKAITINLGIVAL